MRPRTMFLTFVLLLLTRTLVNASPATNEPECQVGPALIQLKVLPYTKDSSADLAIVATGSFGGMCRYFCGTTIHEGTSSDCCSATFQCPDGQTSHPYGYNNGSGWQICGW
jgi:hypothetical protein